jgi:hypothetical protein
MEKKTGDPLSSQSERGLLGNAYSGYAQGKMSVYGSISGR